MRVDFYQLSHDPVEAALVQIAPKVLETGARLLVVAEDAALRDRIDRALWTARPESFVPHGIAGNGHEGRQPVLIGADLDAANSARCLALADGRWRESGDAFDRVFFFFDDASVQHAREMWVDLRAREGVEHNFWRQDGGRWVKAA